MPDVLASRTWPGKQRHAQTQTTCVLCLNPIFNAFQCAIALPPLYSLCSFFILLVPSSLLLLFIHISVNACLELIDIFLPMRDSTMGKFPTARSLLFRSRISWVRCVAKHPVAKARAASRPALVTDHVNRAPGRRRLEERPYMK